MKTIIGIVTSTKMTHSATVKVESLWQHPLYKKRLKKTHRFLVHNQVGAKEGDKVAIVPSRPLSKNKRFTIINVIKA